MNDHDHFQVMIEMRLHAGQLSLDQQTELADHLEKCAACRAFELLATDTENAMTTDTTMQLAATNLEALGERIHTTMKADTRQAVVRVAIVVLAMTPFYLALSHHPWTIVLVWAAAAGLLYIQTRVRVARVMANKNERGELLYTYRREVEHRLRMATYSPFAALFSSAILVNHQMHAEQPFGQRFYFVAGLVVVSLLASAYNFVVRRPAYQAEIARLRQG